MRSVLKLLLPACVAAVPIAAWADRDAFVEANLLAIFYHELGHAVIDTMRLPVFGQEEDAADVASVILVESFYEEEQVLDMTYAAALAFLGEHRRRDEIDFWDVHGPCRELRRGKCILQSGGSEHRHVHGIL